MPDIRLREFPRLFPTQGQVAQSLLPAAMFIDFVQGKNGLEEKDALATAVIVALATDGLADVSDSLPDPYNVITVKAGGVILMRMPSGMGGRSARGFGLCGAMRFATPGLARGRRWLKPSISQIRLFSRFWRHDNEIVRLHS